MQVVHANDLLRVPLSSTFRRIFYGAESIHVSGIDYCHSRHVGLSMREMSTMGMTQIGVQNNHYQKEHQQDILGRSNLKTFPNKSICRIDVTHIFVFARDSKLTTNSFTPMFFILFNKAQLRFYITVGAYVPTRTKHFLGSKTFVLSENSVKVQLRGVQANLTKVSLTKKITQLRTFQETPQNIEVQLKI